MYNKQRPLLMRSNFHHSLNRKWIYNKQRPLLGGGISSFVEQELQQFWQVFCEELVLADLSIQHQELLVKASQLDEHVHNF